jgi:hypothetical protein
MDAPVVDTVPYVCDPLASLRCRLYHSRLYHKIPVRKYHTHKMYAKKIRKEKTHIFVQYMLAVDRLMPRKLSNADWRDVYPRINILTRCMGFNLRYRLCFGKVLFEVRKCGCNEYNSHDGTFAALFKMCRYACTRGCRCQLDKLSRFRREYTCHQDHIQILVEIVSDRSSGLP